MTTPRRVTLTAQELEELVHNAVLKAFDEVGLRVDEPDHRDEAREDFRFIRIMRKSTYGAASKVGLAIILAITSGFVWIVWQGFKLVAK